jgi:hypothetical protein
MLGLALRPSSADRFGAARSLPQFAAAEGSLWLLLF